MKITDDVEDDVWKEPPKNKPVNLVKPDDSYGQFFTFSYEPQQPLFDMLYPEEICMLFYLATYCRRDLDNRISFHNKTPTSKYQLMNYLKKNSYYYKPKNEDKMKKFLEKCLENKIMKINYKKEFYLSEEYFRPIANRNVKQGAVSVFYNPVRKMYENGSLVDLKHFGKILSLIPYTNLTYNVVCSDVLETHLDLIKPLKLSEIYKMQNNLNQNNQTYYKKSILSSIIDGTGKQSDKYQSVNKPEYAISYYKSALLKQNILVVNPKLFSYVKFKNDVINEWGEPFDITSNVLALVKNKKQNVKKGEMM